MTRLALAFVITAAVFAGLDVVWLGQAGPALYAPRLGGVTLPTPRIGPAIAFYTVYIAGLVWFGVRPGLVSGKLGAAVLNGGFFGLVAYATYDLTNQATLKVWPAEITAFDLAWGTFASAVAAGVACLITRALRRA